MDVNSNLAYGVNVHANNPAYGVNNQGRERQVSARDSLYEEVDPPVSVNTSTDGGVTEVAQRELENTNSCKASLVIGIALSTAVLALVVAVVSIGLSTALNSNSEIQSLADKVKSLQLSLNRSVTTIKILGQQISSLQIETTRQYDILNQTVNTIQEHSNILNILSPKGSITNPAISCSEIPTDRPSGEYWIVNSSSSVLVYCDMSRTCCNTTGGWMRVANLNMTDPNQQCPDGFIINNEIKAPLRTCRRNEPQTCLSTTFPVHGIEYSRVCGRVIGYQFGNPYAFYVYYNNRMLTIDDDYVDGASLTHGQSPRKHIWTFAAAFNEAAESGNTTCPCTRSDITYTGVVPPFIGQDYFCDTGSRNMIEYVVYSVDPLWNGQGCGGNSTCCSFNDPPWFCKQLQQPTTDDIELRLCISNLIGDQEILLEYVNIFVQ